MKTLLISIAIISALGSTITILLHSAKGDGLGGIGGNAHMFNSQKGLEAGLDRVTTILVTTFMVSAGILGVFF